MRLQGLCWRERTRLTSSSCIILLLTREEQPVQTVRILLASLVAVGGWTQ
jgi:hypothetical protein